MQTPYKTAGTTYHDMTIGKSGHKFGFPGLYLVVRAAIAAHGVATEEQQKTLFKNFVGGICTPTIFSATSPHTLQHYDIEK